MKISAPTLLLFSLFISLALTLAEPPALILEAPPQDKGLPYTRSARPVALSKIKETIAVFAGSRYAYVKGFKVRLDDANMLRGEAMLRDNHILVPASFAGVLDLKKIAPAAAPLYLVDKWVYDLHLPHQEGAPVDLAELAKGKGLKVYQHPRGLLLISEKEITFSPSEETLLDSVITLFDTPEKLADPDIATRYVPTLARQGKWTDHVKVTPEQLAVLNGPETIWPTAPKSEYDFTGFNEKLLGSKVPPPGVYPRILFSPEDVPMIAERIKSGKLGQMSLIEMEHLFSKSWWDPKTSDGQIFDKLAKGDVAGFQFDVTPETSPTSYPQLFKGQKPGIHNSHIAYIPECLTDMAFYCLLTNDDEHGKKAAAALVSYFKLREPLLDEVNAISDSEFGSTLKRADGSLVRMNGNGCTTHGRTVAGIVPLMNYGLALDFAGKWMTPEQKETMRRIIAKATYGRRPYGQDGPVRFRDVNWVAWDTPHFLGLLAIEGLEGFDPESYQSNAETVRAFCDWGIDDAGVVYESNGKTPGSLQFQTLSMVALARRGENLFGHPHWRKFLTGQIQMTSPSGRVTVNSGTQYTPYSRQSLSFQFADEEKAFFPEDRRPDYLLGRASLFGGKQDEGMREWILEEFDPELFRKQVASVPRLRLPSPMYPGFVHGVIYDTDYSPTTRADLNLPLDFSAPVHGVFSSYSDTSTQATWMNMMVRPDHYLGAGHHHADAGMFHFSALGVDWFTQSPFSGNYEGKYYNLVQVDGHSEAEATPGGNAYNAPGKYLGSTSGPLGASATADLTYAYSYRWQTQPPPLWPEEAKTMGWEMDPSESIMKMFAGTAHYKMRPWWANYNYSNYIATSRAPFNPMEYVYRTTALVRGPHSYGVIVDDLKKDDKTHLYSWAGMLNGGVWKAELPGIKLAQGQTVLAYGGADPVYTGDHVISRPALVPKQGDPLLLVYELGSVSSGGLLDNLISTFSGTGQEAPKDTPALFQIETLAGPTNKKGAVEYYDRMVINTQGLTAGFKVLLIPAKIGEEFPRVTFDKETQLATVQWKDQKDLLSFKKTEEPARTRLVVRRNEAVIVESK